MWQFTFRAFLIVLCVIGWAVMFSLGAIVVAVVGAAVWLARKCTQ
jgi:uncharacterized membrane protein